MGLVLSMFYLQHVSVITIYLKLRDVEMLAMKGNHMFFKALVKMCP
jgi:hypothetical protein